MRREAADVAPRCGVRDHTDGNGRRHGFVSIQLTGTGALAPAPALPVSSAAIDGLRIVVADVLDEGMRALADLIRQGKVRYFGLSNFKGWRIAEIVRLADQLGIDRPVASEPLYNLVDRTAEVEQLPAAAHYGIGVVPYSPLARGVLTGKYAVDAQPPADSRAGRGDRRIQQTEWRPESLHIAQQVAAHAAARGTTSVAFALAWVMKNRIVSSTIAGPRTEAHWDSYIDALTLELGPDDERFVDSLVPPGHASTHGYTDPGYPVEGRKV